MAIQVICPGCHKRFQVSEKFAGQKGPCPSCKQEIKIPDKSEEVVVHAPQDFGPKGVTGEGVLKPISRTEAKFSIIAAVTIGVVVLGVFIAAGVMRGQYNGAVPDWILIVGALLLGPPLALGGYSFLRDDELEPYRGKALWGRTLICALSYAALWGVYAYLVKGYIFNGEPLAVFQLVVVLALIAAAGAFAAHASMEIEFTNGFIHYGLYLLVTVLLRLVMKLDAF